MQYPFPKMMLHIMLNENCKMIIIKLYLFSLKFRKYPTDKVKFLLERQKVHKSQHTQLFVEEHGKYLCC